jgi:hypothetical protein
MLRMVGIRAVTKGEPAPLLSHPNLSTGTIEKEQSSQWEWKSGGTVKDAGR